MYTLNPLITPPFMLERIYLTFCKYVLIIENLGCFVKHKLDEFTDIFDASFGARFDE